MFRGKSDHSASQSFSPALKSKLNSLKENAVQTRTHTALASAPGSRRPGLPGRGRFSAQRLHRAVCSTGVRCQALAEPRSVRLTPEHAASSENSLRGLPLGSGALTASQLDVLASLLLPVPGGRWALRPPGAHPCLRPLAPAAAPPPAGAQAPPLELSRPEVPDSCSLPPSTFSFL